MAQFLRSTPYTPVFPPSLPTPDTPSSASTSCDSEVEALKKTPKPFIDGIKERYILLATVPQELCAPSREASPEAEERVEALRLRMREARDLRFPHIPELTLTCCGLRGGDWVGESASDDEQGDREYVTVLPDTDEEWFRWERNKKAVRERRVGQRKIAKWSEEIEDVTAMQQGEQSQERRADGISSLGFPVVKRAGVVRNKDKGTTSRYFSAQSPSHRELSEPVDRASSPIPPAPALDLILDFSDSFFLPNSPPSLPQIPLNPSIPEGVPSTPSFSKKDTHTSTPHGRDLVLQLSSPVSPPRSLLPLAASQTLPAVTPKRRHDGAQSGEDVLAEDGPSTPRAVKKARTMVEPITPMSVSRPNASQEQPRPEDSKRLPTLSALLAASSKKASPRNNSKSSPSRRDVSVQNLSPSQPSYSMFRPQFQSTQPRESSLPPSPSRPMTSTQPLSSQKTFGGVGTGSSGIGFYQSQFNVEGKVDQVTAFLNADVWHIEP